MKELSVKKSVLLYGRVCVCVCVCDFKFLLNLLKLLTVKYIIVSTYIPYTILMPNVHNTRSLLVHILPSGNIDIPQKSVQY
jgi:hypothetical protein